MEGSPCTSIVLIFAPGTDTDASTDTGTDNDTDGY